MRAALLVAGREYAENAKTRGFWIGLFLFPIIIFLSIQVPILLEQKATPVRYFVLVDQSGSLAPTVEAALEQSYQRQMVAGLKEYARKNLAAPAVVAALDEVKEGDAQSLEAFVARGGKEFFLAQLRPRLRPGAPAFQAPRRLFQQVKLPPGINAEGDLASIAEELKPYLRQDKSVAANGSPVALAAAILIARDFENQIVRPQSQSPATNHQFQYWSANASDPRLREEVERAVNTEIRRREYLARGLDAAVIGQIEHTYLACTSLNPKKEKGREAIGTADVIRQWAPSGFVYLLWVAIFSVMQMLLNNTIEEKSNRIIEVLLSSVTPGELMMGKLMGIAAIGLTMVGAWMAALFGILGWKSGGASELAGQVFVVLRTSNLVPLFGIYFLLGYLMYAAFILSLGSVCNTLKEAQSYMAVMTLLLMVPLLTMAFIPKDPNGLLARVLSWVPLYTPFVMMNRATADPPLIDLAGTLVLLLATTLAALYMAGRIFRIGVLRTGQPPKIVEMLKWALRR
ncbi:MAG: ABC transporter permease [Verrucomicrobiota bacterium]|jgi:ABC-2 type transport system permease protein